jgi:hypothetical protein
VLKPLLIAGAIIGGIFLIIGIETLLWLHEPTGSPHTTDAGMVDAPKE